MTVLSPSHENVNRAPYIVYTRIYTCDLAGELTGVGLLVDSSHSLEVVDTVDGRRRLLEPNLRLVLVRERPTTNNRKCHYINVNKSSVYIITLKH